jgi:hypothetical protein
VAAPLTVGTNIYIIFQIFQRGRHGYKFVAIFLDKGRKCPRADDQHGRDGGTNDGDPDTLCHRYKKSF